MNINEFKEKFGHLKDSDVIQVSCDHPLHNTGELKPMKVQSVKRNILKNNGERLVCRSCYMSHNNPMQNKGEPNRKSLGEINVMCPECGKTRLMNSNNYFGTLTEPYVQICGSCAQKGKEISEEQRKKISESLTGRELSDEHKANLSDYMKNNPEGIERGKTNLVPGAGGGWNTGMETPDEVKEKQSKALKGVKKTLEHKFNISKGRKKMLEETGGFTREHRENISKATIEQYKNGFEPKMFHLKGWHFSQKLEKLVFHRSSYEKKRYMQLDEDVSVVSYAPEAIEIQYFNPEKHITSTYLADILVTYADGHKELEEVKPDKWLDNNVVGAKITAGESWAKENGIIFKIVSEIDLYGSEDTAKKTKEFSDWLKVYLKSGEYIKMAAEKLPKVIKTNKEKTLEELIEESTKNVIAWYHDYPWVLWTVEQKHEKPEIYCLYLDYSPTLNQWYICDDISEMEGPAALTCPLEFFNLAPDAEFPEWREEVKKHHQGGPAVQNGEVAIKLMKSLFEDKNQKGEN